MALPLSFTRDGFKTADEIKLKRRRVMIGTEGESESGKSEFILSAPGPGIVICIDRGYEAMLDNPNPPDTRNPDFAFDPIHIPVNQQVQKEDYVLAWTSFRDRCYKAISNPDCLTLGIDTHNAAWELQKLAEFGRLTQIHPQSLGDPNAIHRAFLTRLFDSGKNIIGTNMLKDEYIDVMDPITGKFLKDAKTSRNLQEKTGERKRQGFGDQEYLWQIQLRHFVQPAHVNKVTKKYIPRRYGIKILKCKANSEHVGSELTGSDCNFKTLVNLIYPNVPDSGWGYKP